MQEPAPQVKPLTPASPDKHHRDARHRSKVESSWISGKEPKVCGHTQLWGSSFSPLVEPSAGPASGHSPGSCAHLVFPSPFFAYLFFMSRGQSWNRWLSPVWHVAGPPPEAGSCMYPAQRAQFHRIWKHGCKAGYLVGQEKGGHALSSARTGVHGFPMALLQVSTGSAASNNTHCSSYSSGGQRAN